MHLIDNVPGGGTPITRSGNVTVIGIGGPVGSGKTALVESLSRTLQSRMQIAVVTNDIFTKEDAEFLTRRGVLPEERILGVETGAAPIRPSAKMPPIIKAP